MKRIFTAILMLVMYASVVAQIQMPAPSPTFELKGTIGLSEVMVKYSRPSAKGREIAGNLIPYNEVWRTGANEPTKISFSKDVMVEGQAVPAGEYALYSQFTKERATIILSKNLTLWGAMGYDSKDDLIRFDVPVKHPSSHYETFTISFSDFTMNSANLNMKWGHTKAMFNIEHPVDGEIMQEIKAQLIDSTPENAGVYFQAATYYYDTERDANQALAWVDKALAAQEQYWVVHLKAKILVRLGKSSEAKAAANKSMELARSQNNMDYVRLNEKLIASLND